MAYICTKEKKCKECEHFLYDEENDRMACFAEIDEEVRTKLDAEITEFRKSYEDKTKKEIYNDWYVINFYENYYELLVNNICDIKTVESTINRRCRRYFGNIMRLVCRYFAG